MLFSWLSCKLFPISLSKTWIETHSDLGWCKWTEGFVAFSGNGSKMSVTDEVRSLWLMLAYSHTECGPLTVSSCMHEAIASRVIQEFYHLCWSFRFSRPSNMMKSLSYCRPRVWINGHLAKPQNPLGQQVIIRTVHRGFSNKVIHCLVT